MLTVLEHHSGPQLLRAAVSTLLGVSALMGLQTSLFLGPRDTQPGPSGPHGKLRGSAECEGTLTLAAPLQNGH